MTVTIDTTAVRRRGGAGAAGIARYALNLVEALRRAAPAERVDEFALSTDPVVARHLDWGDRRWRALAAISHALPLNLEARIGPTDVFIAADHVLPRLRRARSVFILYDCTYLTAPQTHSTFNRLYLQALMPSFLRAADAVVAISESTRRDAERFYPLPAGRVEVVYPGVGPAFAPVHAAARLTALRARYRLPDRFVLFVGTFEPRKNLAVVLRALAQPGLRDVPLVVAGRPGWLVAETERLIESLGLGARVLRIGRVPDEDLPALYTSAEAFVFPSLYEGFGLPALEALACGAPVLAADTSSLPEVVGAAGRLLPPHAVDAWADAIATLWGSAAQRDSLRAAGPGQAQRFSWDETASRFWSICHALL